MVQKKIHRAVYPGTFDPVTNGHVSLVERASQLFDELVVAVARDGGKSPLFDFEDRIGFMTAAVGRLRMAQSVKVIGFEGLTAELVKKLKAQVIVRGLRAVSDFEYEFQMALMNRKLVRDVETVYLMPSLSWVYLSSSIVKDVARNRGDVSGLVPPEVNDAITAKFPGRP
ncbi:MAG TPA: pantetheine-phosphate adenylyltransferase [Acidobacteriota bacterium]|nr:pantetheine-phosphate adenylyltransferase [Acidobacteriota bacterium]